MADGPLTPYEAALPGLGVVPTKSYSVALPVPVAPKAPCLTCAKEPVVTVPKAGPTLATMPTVTPTQPTSPATPKPSVPTTVPTSSVLDQELMKLRQELLQKVASPSVPVVAPSTQPPPSTMPRPIITPAPALAAPRELLWSQLGVGYVGMQPFARPMTNGGLSGLMTGLTSLLFDWDTKIIPGKTTIGCDLSIRVVGRDGAKGGPDGDVSGGTASVNFKAMGGILPECAPGLMNFIIRIVGTFKDASGQSYHLTIGDEQTVGRQLTRTAKPYISELVQVSFDRREVLRGLNEIEGDGKTFVNGSTELEIVATIYDTCGCVESDFYHAKFGEFFDYERDPKTDRAMPTVSANQVVFIPDFSDPARAIRACHIDVSVVGVFSASEPKRDGGTLTGGSASGGLLLQVTVDPDCAPAELTTVLQSARGSQVGVTVELNGKDVSLPVKATVEPAQATIPGKSGVVAIAVSFPIDEVDAAVASAVGQGGSDQVSHAYETMRAYLTIQVVDACNCVSTKTLHFGK